MEMKLFQKVNSFKAILLFFLLFNMEILVLNSNIKLNTLNIDGIRNKKFSIKEYNEPHLINQTRSFSFVQKHSAKKKRRMHKAISNKIALRRPDPPSKNNEKLVPNYLAKEEFFDISKKTEEKFNVPDSTIRVFTKELFDSEYKDYNEKAIREQKDAGYTFLKN